jgi:hypothetical protein
MQGNVDTLDFVVSEHNQNQKIKKGDVVEVYKIKLESTNGKFQIQRKSENPDLLEEFPLGAHVAINMRMAKQEVFPTP